MKALRTRRNSSSLNILIYNFRKAREQTSYPSLLHKSQFRLSIKSTGRRKKTTPVPKRKATVSRLFKNTGFSFSKRKTVPSLTFRSLFGTLRGLGCSERRFGKRTNKAL